MSIFTTGSELTTSLTNLIIFIISIYSLLNTKNKSWRLFFLLMSIDSLLGTIVHGLILSTIIKNFIWIFLTIFFVLTIHTIFHIFTKIKLKYCLLLSIIISIILLIQFILKQNFLFTFTMYVVIIMIISIYYLLKNNNNSKSYYLSAFIVQVLGGIFLLSKTSFKYLNFNGIYHIFMSLTVLFFYLGTKKDD